MRAEACAASMFVAACGPIAGVPLGEQSAQDESSSPGASSSAETGPAGCGLPTLDAFTLGQLYIDPGQIPDVARGTTRQLRIKTIASGAPKEVAACVTWSVTPTVGASISAQGLLGLDAGTPVGSQFVVTADIEEGRRVLDLEVMAYEPVNSPLVGTWSETLRIACDGSGPFAPSQPVGELRFLDNGDFRVTWTPLAAYVDYWGSFTHAIDTGALVLTVSGGNETPADLDPVGMAAITKDGTLVLTDVFLGSAPGETAVPACGHRF